MEIAITTEEELLRSNFELGTSAEPRVHELDETRGAFGCGDDAFMPHDEQRETEEREMRERMETAALFDEQLERRQATENGEMDRGESCDADGTTSMLIDGPEVEGDIVVGGSTVGEENDVMDSADMCYDSVVLPTLPPEGSHDGQEPGLEYTETYMGSLGERETVPAPSSPSAFFQTSNMDSTGVAASWGDLHSTHEESGYGTGPPSDASPGGGNSTEERAFVDSLCEEPSKEDDPAIMKDQRLSCPSYENGGTQNTQFEAIHSSGVLDPENEYSSILAREELNHAEAKRTTSGPLQPKEKAPLVELSLRSVLSDPITGAFMDDAMVAMCGHSYGDGSLQRVMETHLCVNCGASVPPSTLVPNFALRAAVLAYKHEDQLWHLSSVKGTKRRREQFEQPEGSEPKRTARDRVNLAENTYADTSRSKGVQFPFSVNDRVLIKGNKRTPERFVGREAVITNQCLNGWYLVRTLDTGESVRLQYRSLRKLGEMELPYTSEARDLVAQPSDACGRPVGIDNPIKSKSDYGLESGSLTDQQNNEIGTSGYHGIASKDLKGLSVERESSAALKGAVDAGSNPTLCSGTPNPSQGLLGDQGKINNFMGEPPKALDSSDDQVLDARENLKGQVGNFDAAGEKSGVGFLNSMNTVQVESDDGQLLHNGSHHDTGAKFWIGENMCCTDPPPLRNEQGSPSNWSTGPGGDSLDVEELPSGVSNQENGSEPFQTRSRRTALQFKSSTFSGTYLQDSDPYRKVYTSGSRRRGGKGDSVVTVIPDHLPADSKSFMKLPNNMGKSSEKGHFKGLTGGASGGRKGVDMKPKSIDEILQMMRKDMLKLEKQIPQNYASRLWRVHRLNWRKHVKASCTVQELGAKLRDFRYALLLTTAGGMPDEEWDMQIGMIIESGNVESLVSLWGKLCGDVYKWLECRPKSLKGKDVQWWRPSADDMEDFYKQGPHSRGGSTSSVQMTTAATLAAVDAVGEGHQDPDTSIKTLLASTMKLLQQQNRMELAAVRESLELEKRHIAAKLAHLEGSFAHLGGASEPSQLNLTHQTGLVSSETGQGISSSVVPLCQGNSIVEPASSRQPYEMEEADSDTALPTQEAEADATDMSDSD